MNLLVTYDVNTLTPEGRRRLRRVAKICEGWGQRVQLSVFECTVNEAQKELLVGRLTGAIDAKEDSLRIYHLRGAHSSVVECYGIDAYRDFTAPLIV